MNIFGIGTDIVNIKRIKNSLKKNTNFKKRIFTKFETKICEKRANKINCFAKRFAAKEALFKALGIHNKINKDTGKEELVEKDGKSMIGILRLGIAKDNPFTLVLDGNDEEAYMSKFEDLIENE